ncbi:MAG: DUF3611 family protein [Gloeocapsa sp. UFS-A4-WI-NPMV-4B04]|jgi:uncharacterized protein with PQ loop repeat|nr:DUF3611 family protein [Gloeocapsa sp. UFS-A4-WI-NPMV-4B04]
MLERPESKSTSTIQEIAQTFRLTGWASFWAQLVLGVVAAVILGFASLSRDVSTGQKSVGTGLGIFFAVIAVIALGASIFWAFRYIRISKQLQSSNPNNRPRKADTIQLLRLGLSINLVGLLVGLIGAQAIVGALVAKSLTLPQAGVGVYQVDPSRIIRPLDIFVVQANTNTVAAHFAGLIGSLWLLNRVNRQ